MQPLQTSIRTHRQQLMNDAPRHDTTEGAFSHTGPTMSMGVDPSRGVTGSMWWYAW